MDRIDFDKYVENGYYIGSGAIESGNKVGFPEKNEIGWYVLVSTSIT